MDPYTLEHLSDGALFGRLNAIVSRDRVNLAVLLAHLAEFDARRLYVSAGYPSMFNYCVEALHYSEPETGRRIQAARTARRFPILFPAISAGRLHLTAIGMLAPHLTNANASELAEAATHRSKYAIETLLARRFPEALPKVKATVLIRAVAPPLDTAVPLEPPPLFTVQLHRSDEVDRSTASSSHDLPPDESSPLDVQPHTCVPIGHSQHLPGDVVASSPPRSASPEHFLVRVTIPKRTHDKLREAQALLSHAVRGEDVAQVLDRALDALIALLKRRRIGSASRLARSPGHARLATTGGRYIPAEIRRSVWERDEGQCTFTSADGHRCGERHFLQFDHAEPVARGGPVTVDTIRLRCGAHNQYEAERAFGTAFMARKRQEAARARNQGKQEK